MGLTEAEGSAVALAATVRQRLVDFALSPPFERYLRKIVLDAAGDPPLVTDAVMTAAVDTLLYKYRTPDGSTAIDRFARRADVDESMLAMARGFEGRVNSIFEVEHDTTQGAEVVAVRCCLADLEHLVAPTESEDLPPLASGSFLVGSLVPVAGTRLWTSFDQLELIPPSERAAMATAVLDLALTAPWLTYRNPEKREQAVRKVTLMHQRFLARHGTDLALVRGDEVADVYGDLLVTDDLRDEVRASNLAMAVDSVEEAGLASADYVLVHCHPIAGPGFYTNYPAVERALRAGETADPNDLAFLRGYLEDDAIPAWLIRRIVTEHLPSSEAALRRALRKPRFSWERDGERLLASSPGAKQPEPRISIVPAMCADLA